MRKSSVIIAIVLLASCATVENERVEVSSETNAIVLPEDDPKARDGEEPYYRCEQVYRVVMAHTYELDQRLTGEDGKLLLGAQTVAGTLIKLGASEEKDWRGKPTNEDYANEAGLASLGAVAAALAFVEAESKERAAENEPRTLYTDEKRLLKVRHCLDIAKVSHLDAESAARTVSRHARNVPES